jgi:tRNA(Ile)-lysidine synthase
MHRIEKHIQSNWSHLSSKSISIACSGGLDSMVLLALFCKLELDVNVLHVNYKLRGQDSEDDEKFVRKFCQSKSIKCEVRQIDLNEQLKSGGNLQQKARDFRYKWFQEIANGSDNNRIALAQHVDDQVETFFINLARKSGIMGLACMPEENNGIIRPLLPFKKEELSSYAKENRIQWREDRSNSDKKYRRNLLRNEVLPFVKKTIPTLEESVLILVRQFQSKQNELELAVEPIYKSILKNHMLSMHQFEKMSENAKIELFRMLEQPHGIAQEVEKLNQKGTKVPLLAATDHTFSSVVFDKSQLSFVSAENKSIPHLKFTTIDTLPEKFGKTEIYLNPERIEGKLILRRWKSGDRISPVGMNGTRLISDIVSDAKLTGIQKQNIFVLEDEKYIHWCVNLCIGRVALASENTEKIKVQLSY